MATERKKIVTGWHADNNITATADIAVEITNTEARALYWAVMESGLPAFDVSLAHKIGPFDPSNAVSKSEKSITLSTGDILCLAFRGATGEITVTTGDA